MDQIKKAIERAKSDSLAAAEPMAGQPAVNRRAHVVQTARNMFDVKSERLEASRIVAHLPAGAASIQFDLLRTRVLQHMWSNGMRTIVITSPSAACGKTVTAINLAISMARLDNGQTILVDLDLRKPQIATYLGIRPTLGLYDALYRKAPLADVLVSITAAGEGLSILPTLSPATRPSETIGSQDMREMVKSLTGLYQKSIVIFDMPPVLVADDLISFMPNVDGVLLVAAANETTDTDLSECMRLIPETKLVGVVLTKSEEKQNSSYYSYGYV